MGRRGSRVTRGSAQLDTGLNAKAQAKFDECVAEFQRDLLAEAERLEAGQGEATAEREITSTMVHDANTFVRRAYRKPRRSPLVIAAQLVTAAFLVIVGYAVENMKEPWGPIVFAVSLTVAMIATLVSLMTENR